MGPVRLFLSTTVLAIYWTSVARGMLTNSINRCDAAPCNCDSFGRLTCDCEHKPEELVLTTEGDRRLSPHTSRITIKNCPRVILENSSLSSMGGLRAISFLNVGNLTLYRQSFEVSSRQTRARISISNTSIDLMPSFTFKGDVEVILLERSRIGRINAFAFANLVGTDSVSIVGCVIEDMEAQAFKKFDVGYFHVIGGSFGDVVPSRAMNDIEVRHKFMLDGVMMGTVQSSAFIIRSPNTVAIQNCVIEQLEGEAFSLTTRGAVIVKNNTFNVLGPGSFLGLRSDPESKSFPLSDLIFKDNTVKHFEPGSLIFDRRSYRLELENVFVDRPCDCGAIPSWRGNVMNYTEAYSRFDSFEEPLEERPDTFSCADPKDNLPVTFLEFEEDYCTANGSTLVLITSIVGFALFLVVVGPLIVWCCRRRRENNQKHWISVPTNAPDVVSKKNGVIGRDGPVDSRITMVVPDGRVYRETEFHVIVEKAEPLTTEL